MTETFNITNKTLIYITKNNIYKDLTILNIVKISSLATIIILLMIACKKFAKIMIDLFGNSMKFDTHSYSPLESKRTDRRYIHDFKRTY